MVNSLVKTMMAIHMNLSWFMGFLVSYHLAFYPNVENSVVEDWKGIIFWFGQGLVLQYYLLHYSNKHDQESEQ